MVDSLDSTTAAMVAYLRAEADAAEQRANSLRAQADQLAELHGVSSEMQDRYEVGPEELAPMDENGVPKYKGRKRGRKPKARKRKANPNRKKRAHTAYTLFVKQHYPAIRAAHADRPSKDIIAIVAKQWAQVPAEEKKVWKERAVATQGEEEGAIKDDDHSFVDAEESLSEEVTAEVEETDEYVEEQEKELVQDDDDEPAPPVRRRTRR